MDRYSEYRVMWILVFFDLPTETQKDKKAYTLFRKNLQKDGFTMFQFSIYVRHCAYSGGYPFSISGDIRSVPS